MAPVTIDWTIKFSDIILIAGFLISAAGGSLGLTYVIGKLMQRVDGMSSDISELQESYNEMAKAVSALVGQQISINTLTSRADRQDKLLDDLRRGEGFIVRAARAELSCPTRRKSAKG